MGYLLTKVYISDIFKIGDSMTYGSKGKLWSDYDTFERLSRSGAMSDTPTKKVLRAKHRKETIDPAALYGNDFSTPYMPGKHNKLSELEATVYEAEDVYRKANDSKIRKTLGLGDAEPKLKEAIDNAYETLESGSQLYNNSRKLKEELDKVKRKISRPAKIQKAVMTVSLATILIGGFSIMEMDNQTFAKEDGPSIVSLYNEIAGTDMDPYGEYDPGYLMDLQDRLVNGGYTDDLKQTKINENNKLVTGPIIVSVFNEKFGASYDPNDEYDIEQLKAWEDALIESGFVDDLTDAKAEAKANQNEKSMI